MPDSNTIKKFGDAYISCVEMGEKIAEDYGVPPDTYVLMYVPILSATQRSPAATCYQLILPI